MKIARILSLVLALLMLSVCFVACTEKKEEKMTIKLWVSTTKGVKEFTEKQVEAFKALHPEYDFNIVVEAVGEGDAATQVITDVATAPDIYCFAQDQLARLVQVGALNKLGVAASEEVTKNNDASAVKAATVDGNLYCYPLTSDNGYFMFYDKSVIKESSLDSLEAIIADCEAAGKNFSFETDTSGWYNASWFFATGCKSDWTLNDEGKQDSEVCDLWESISKNENRYLTGTTNEKEKIIAFYGNSDDEKRPYIRAYYKNN